MSRQTNREEKYKVVKPNANIEEIRLDKYLTISRTYKHRSDAVEDVEGGKVKVNGKRVKSSKMVKIGDIVTFKRDGKYIKFKIKDVTTKNARKEEAADIFYEKLEEVVEVDSTISEHMKEMKEILNKQDQENRKDMSRGKPSKKERRVLNKYKKSES